MRAILAALLALGLALTARAEGERAGEFDYYVLALSWSPTYCALEGARTGSPQCDRPQGWVLHGLWPQYEDGWPSWCRTAARDPARAETAAMADIHGTAGLAWHAWKKHGRCSGLDPADYFAAARRAFDSVAKPPVLRALDRPVTLPARVIEEAFLEANPALSADMVTITCEAGRIDEARICLARDDLSPRPCGRDVRRDCTATNALLDPIR